MEIKKIVWSEEFDTSITEIDKQHRQIVAQLNSLLDDLVNNRSKFAQNIDTLLETISIHQASEELYLLDKNYLPIEPIQEEHQRFQKIFYNYASSLKSQIPYENRISILTEMMDCWMKHLIEEDLKLKNCLVKRPSP